MAKKKKKKLTPEERKRNKEKADHKRLIRTAFRDMGFDRASELAGVEVNMGGQAGEFDDAFVYENLVVLVEYTTSQSSDVTSHIKNKSLIFGIALKDPKATLAYLRKKIPAFDERLGDKFHADRYILKILYCSLNPFDEGIKKVVPGPIYLDYPFARYFGAISSIIKMSALSELLLFLEIVPIHIARNGVFPSKSPSDSFDGSILPESSSGFPA